jgi:signal transduction histidine kinase
LITQLENKYSSIISEKSAKLKILLNWDGIVMWDRNQVQQALMNLMQNSIDAISLGGAINIYVEMEVDQIVITIEDNGHGISQSIRSKIFNLYFTTKASGTGIGLSVVQRIVYEHNGTIEIESSENKGAVFKIKLPIIPNLNHTLS